MEIQSRVFVLFLFIFTFVTTHSWAQKYGIAPQTELEASQEAHWLGEEIRANQPAVTEFRMGVNRSIDAMHWTAVDVNQRSQFVPATDNRPIDTPKVVPFTIRIDKPVTTPVNTMERSADQRL